MGTSTGGGHLATELLNVELGLKLKQAAPGQENSAILAQSKSSPVSFLSYFKLYTPRSKFSSAKLEKVATERLIS